MNLLLDQIPLNLNRFSGSCSYTCIHNLKYMEKVSMWTTTSSSVLVKGKTILLFFSPLIYHEKDKDNCFLLFFLAQFESRGTLLLWSIWRSFFVVQRKEINLTEKNIVYHWYQKKAIEIFDSTLPSILMSIVFMLSHPEMWTNCQYVVKPSSIIIRIIKCVSPTEWARLNLFCSNSYKI